MQRTFVIGLSIAVLIGCASSNSTKRRPEFVSGFPTYDCPAYLENQIKVVAEVFPLGQVAVRDDSVRTDGARARRIMLTLQPAGLNAEDTVTWSSISVSTLGGTFGAWTRLHTKAGTIEPMNSYPLAVPNKGAKDDEATISVATSSGQLRITRHAHGKTNLMDPVFIDASIMPGGSIIEDVKVATLELWRPDGTPRAAELVRLDLAPVRHPPGLDVVDALVEASFVVRISRTREEWACAADTRVLLVAKDAVREPYWDLGLGSSNAARKEWLGLFSTTRGAIRPMFDSPATAHEFVRWLQTSNATNVAGYSIGAFKQTKLRAMRPYGALDADAMSSFRPMRADEFGALRVGAVGEP